MVASVVPLHIVYSGSTQLGRYVKVLSSFWLYFYVLTPEYIKLCMHCLFLSTGIRIPKHGYGK